MTAAVTNRGPRSVPEGVEYHRVLAGEKRRIGRGILAIALLIGGLFGALQIFYLLGLWIDGLIRPAGSADPAMLTPVTLATSLAGTALLIPWSMLIQRWLYGVRGPSLHSVVSRFRFGLFGRALLGIVPLIVVALAFTEFLDPWGTAVWSRADLIGFFVVAILVMPLQAAGEEYGLRGLVFRIGGSWARGPWASLLGGIIVSAAVFAVIHTALDPWWNVYYVVFSVTTALVTWRTGGIEIAVVIHSAFNVLSLLYWIILHADLSERFDRSTGAVTAAFVIPGVVALVAITVAVWLRTRRSGPLTTPTSPEGG